MSATPNEKDTSQIFFLDGFKIAEDMITEKSNPSVLFSAMILQYNEVKNLTQTFENRCEKDGIKIDCKKACSWCCHQPVFASSHEVLLLVTYLYQNCTMEEINQIKERAKKKYAETKKLNKISINQNNTACPLLKDGVCSAYIARPMACRIYLSSNVETCKEKFKGVQKEHHFPALFDFMLNAGRHMNEGFTSRLLELGFSPTETTIEEGLVTILENKNCFHDWINGEKITPSFIF